MQLEFKRLTQIQIGDIIELNNHPKVLKQMPLGSPNFSEKIWERWVEEKENQWTQYGYGPYAFVIDGNFAGWGGLQHEEGNADMGLVLHPNYWGYGKVIFEKIIKCAFIQMKLESITILLPLSRTKLKAITRFGFQFEENVEYDGVIFQRFRLLASNLINRVDIR